MFVWIGARHKHWWTPALTPPNNENTRTQTRGGEERVKKDTGFFSRHKTHSSADVEEDDDDDDDGDDDGDDDDGDDDDYDDDDDDVEGSSVPDWSMMILALCGVIRVSPDLTQTHQIIRKRRKVEVVFDGLEKPRHVRL